MGLTKFTGQFFKQLLFGNKRIKATTYEGWVIYIPIEILANMIHQTRFDVVEEKENFVAVDFTFIPKEETK